MRYIHTSKLFRYEEAIIQVSSLQEINLQNRHLDVKKPDPSAILINVSIIANPLNTSEIIAFYTWELEQK